MKADCQGLVPRRNLLERNLSSGPHLIASKATIEWELLIGATTVTHNSICCLQKTQTRLSNNWLKRSNPFLSREEPPKAMRLENRLSANWFGSSSEMHIREIRSRSP